MLLTLPFFRCPRALLGTAFDHHLMPEFNKFCVCDGGGRIASCVGVTEGDDHLQNPQNRPEAPAGASILDEQKASGGIVVHARRTAEQQLLEQYAAAEKATSGWAAGSSSHRSEQQREQQKRS